MISSRNCGFVNVAYFGAVYLCKVVICLVGWIDHYNGSIIEDMVTAARTIRRCFDTRLSLYVVVQL